MDLNWRRIPTVCGMLFISLIFIFFFFIFALGQYAKKNQVEKTDGRGIGAVGRSRELRDAAASVRRICGRSRRRSRCFVTVRSLGLSSRTASQRLTFQWVIQ